MTTRRSAAEIVAFHLCTDISDVRDARYQQTRYCEAVFSMGRYYYCAPTLGKRLPNVGYEWEPVGTYYGRDVYRADSEGPQTESV